MIADEFTKLLTAPPTPCGASSMKENTMIKLGVISKTAAHVVKLEMKAAR